MKVHAITVQQLRTFCLVYTKRSFSDAAQLVGLATSSVWAQMEGLEAHYVAELFVRAGRGVRPTPAADALYRSLVPILGALDAIQVNDQATSQRMSIAIGDAIVVDVAAALRNFLREPEQENVSVRLQRVRDQAVDDLITAGEADIGIWQVTKTEILDRSLNAERICPVTYWMVYPSSHPLADVNGFKLPDLARYPLIVAPQGSASRKLLEAALLSAEKTTPLTVVVETNDVNIMIGCVRAGLGVGIAAGPQSIFQRDGLEARSLHGELGDAWLAIGYKRGRKLTPALTSLLKRLRESATAASVAGASGERKTATLVRSRRIKITKPHQS